MAFARSEFDNRLARCRRSMAEKGIDLHIDSDPANMLYLTGYDGTSYYVPQVVIIPIEEEEPVWIGRGVDFEGARLTTYLSDDNILKYPEDLVQQPDRHPMDFIGAQIERRGWGGRRIGIENDCYYFTPRCRDALQASLPNATFVDAGLLVNWVRLIKSDAEIDALREAGHITDRVMGRFLELVEPGVRECDVAAELSKTLLAYSGSYAGSCPILVGVLAAAERSSAAHLPWTDQPYKNGDLVFLESGGARHRYHCPLARSLHLGPPPPRVADANDAVIEGMEAALRAVKPGNRCEEVEAAWRRSIEKHGLVKESRIGYPVGIGYPPDWGEHTASLRPGDKSELQVSMVFHMICGIWQEGWGVVISETLRVSEEGAQTFSELDRGLSVKF